MIFHSGAARFYDQLKGNRERVVLAELNAITPAGNVPGSGTVELTEGKFGFVWRPSDGSGSDDMIKEIMREWDGPRTYTRQHRWKFEVATHEGFRFEFDAFPPAEWRSVNHRMAEIDFEADRLRAVSEKWDPDDEALFHATLEKYGWKPRPEREAQEPPEEILHHALFLGISSPLCGKSRTETEVTNEFFGKSSGWAYDTWTLDHDGMTFALIQREEGLHAYLRLRKSVLSEEEQKQKFTAFLNALAVTHGFRPWPMVKEVRHDGDNVRCELAETEQLSQMSLAPLTKHLVDLRKEGEAMVVAAYDYLADTGGIAMNLGRLHGILCEAHEGKTIRESDLLALCTVFEGLVSTLFDHHGLKQISKTAVAAAEFKDAVASVTGWLEGKDSEAGCDSESAWSRLIGIIKSCGYVRTEEKLKVLSNFYGIPWVDDMEQVLKKWKKQRNPLAHGAGRDRRDNELPEMFAAWSRITGAFHRLMLAEMNYSGWFRYSPMEAGREELKIDLRPGSTLASSV